MPRRHVLIGIVVAALVTPAFGDETLYRYEGDVLPYDGSAGWLIADVCDPPCSESLEEDHFVLSWPVVGNAANYAYRIAEPPESPPPHAVGRVAIPVQHGLFWNLRRLRRSV